MNNNKILQIKDKKERLIEMRKEIIGDSCKSLKENKISIYKIALDSLERADYEMDHVGTKLLAKLVTILYHERKMYRRCDVDKRYWNLSDWGNEHYKMLGADYLMATRCINDAINHSDDNGSSIAEVAYEMADYYAYLYNNDERRERYTKMLK